MGKRVISLFLLWLSVSAFAANRAETQCTSASTINTVKKIIWEQMAPLGINGRISQTTFGAKTRVLSVEPTRYDTELKIAECLGQFTVDASGEFDPDVARSLERTYARMPDLTLMLSMLLQRPPQGRVYDFQIAYSSQIKGINNYVEAGGFNDFKLLVTAGFLATKAPVKTSTPQAGTGEFSDFKCAHALPDDATRRAELNRFMDWVLAKHPDWTLEEMTAYRHKLLQSNGCL